MTQNELSKPLWGEKLVNADNLKNVIDEIGDHLLTGFKPLDDWDFYIFSREVMLLQGYSGDGKTTVALQLALSLVKHNPHIKVCFYSLEIGETDIKVKVASLESLQSIKSIYTKTCDAMKTNLQSYNFWNPCLNRFHTEYNLRNIKDILQNATDYGFNVIFIDYLTLLKWDDRTTSDNYNHHELIISAIKSWCEKNNTSAILLAQIRKPVGGGENAKITKFGNKGSGAFTYTADAIYGIDRFSDKEKTKLLERLQLKTWPTNLDGLFLTELKKRRYPSKYKKRAIFFDKKTCQIVEFKNQKMIFQHETEKEVKNENLL